MHVQTHLHCQRLHGPHEVMCSVVRQILEGLQLKKSRLVVPTELDENRLAAVAVAMQQLGLAGHIRLEVSIQEDAALLLDYQLSGRVWQQEHLVVQGTGLLLICACLDCRGIIQQASYQHLLFRVGEQAAEPVHITCDCSQPLTQCCFAEGRALSLCS